MVVNAGEMTASGTLSTRVIRANRKPKEMAAPLLWKIKNYSRPAFIKGYLANWAAKQFSKYTGRPTLTAELYGVLIKANGDRINYGLLSPNVVTTAFVNFMVDQLQAETTEWGDFKYHDSGVGSTAENVADTAIETTDGEARVTGSQTEGASANIYRSVGTITYTSTLSIREHMLFSQLAAGVGLDRSVFGVITVDPSDSIEFTYELTVNSGG